MIPLILFILCLLIELSPRINTDNILKKIGVGFIMVGALVDIAGSQSQFIEMGLVIYLVTNLLSAYVFERKRRAGE